MSPEAEVATSVLTGLVAVWMWRFFRAIANAPRKPDPWPASLEEEINREDATQLCHRCLTPQTQGRQFCENCGTSIGKYNNVMFPQACFSIGEISVHGVSDPLPHPKASLILGYLLLPVGAGFCFLAPFFFFLAPCFWARFFLNLARSRSSGE